MPPRPLRARGVVRQPRQPSPLAKDRTTPPPKRRTHPYRHERWFGRKRPGGKQPFWKNSPDCSCHGPAQKSGVLKLKVAVRMRLMPERALTITARVAFFLCGVISLVTAAPYVLLRGVDLPVQSEWVIFSVALGLVGVFSMTAAVLPRSWIAKICRKDRDDQQLFPAPPSCLAASRQFHMAWQSWPISLRTAGISIRNSCFRCVRCIS